MYGEGIRGMGQEPGFMVVKKNEVSEKEKDEPVTDLNVKEWEVRSLKTAQSPCTFCFLSKFTVMDLVKCKVLINP